MSKLRIAIYSEMGPKMIPNIISSKITEKSKIRVRIQMAELLDKLEYNCLEIDNYCERIEDILNRDNYIKQESDDNGYNIIFRQIGPDGVADYHINVIEVDTSTPWRISTDIRGSEYIEYNQRICMVDPELNYADWK